jgi:hypothetical protein
MKLFAPFRLDAANQCLCWYWRMPLAAGMTELWLAKGDPVSAQLEAEGFLNNALSTAERAWQGLAWEANARVALAMQDHPRARVHREIGISGAGSTSACGCLASARNCSGDQ